MSWWRVYIVYTRSANVVSETREWYWKQNRNEDKKSDQVVAQEPRVSVYLFYVRFSRGSSIRGKCNQVNNSTKSDENPHFSKHFSHSLFLSIRPSSGFQFQTIYMFDRPISSSVCVCLCLCVCGLWMRRWRTVTHGTYECYSGKIRWPLERWHVFMASQNQLRGNTLCNAAVLCVHSLRSCCHSSDSQAECAFSLSHPPVNIGRRLRPISMRVLNGSALSLTPRHLCTR